MVFFLRTFLVFGLFVLGWEQAIAAPPSLALNPSEFSYNATITAVLIENCTELSNPNNILIASVNGQVRGYVNSSTVVGSRYMAFLTVYSNKASGDTLVFQIYKADTDQLLAVKTKLIFQEDGVYGSPSVPQEIQTNNRPTDLKLSSLQIPEHLTPNQNVATISANDLDKDNTLSYSLVAGTNSTDNARFQIAGTQLQVKGVLNTALKDTFQIRLQVADNLGCTLEKAFSLVVDKVNDAPTNLQLTDSLFSENEPSPSIGTFLPTDPDFNDSFTFSFVAGAGDADNSQFAIAGTLLSFKSTANYEVKKVYLIRCRVTDRDGLFFDKAFTLYVRDKNDPPTNIVLSNNKVFENEPANQFVAKLYSIDEDAVDKYEYTFSNVGTNDNFSFTIHKDTLRANKAFDFETKSNYIVYLTSTDSLGLSVTKPFVITIKDTLDIPTDIQLSNASVTENTKSMTAIGVLSTVDANVPAPTYTYSFVTGKGSADNSSFSIKNDTLYTKDTLDFEAKNKFSVRVRTSLPNGMNTEKELSISVLDLPSTGIVLSNIKVYENEPAKQFVAKISTNSQDKDDRYAYSFGNVGTHDNSSFLIENDTLWANKVFDFETKSSYNVYITSTSLSGAAITKPFIISIKDTLDIPTDVLLSNASITENAKSMTVIGVLSTVDANVPAPTYTYSFVTGKGSTNNSSFIIRHDTLFTQDTLDFEVKNKFSIRVRTTLINGMYTEKELNISVLDLPSTGIVLSNTKVYENEPAKQFVAKISTTSQDKDDRYAYSFGNVGTHDNASFLIENDTLWANKVFDFETKSSYNVYITSTSLSGAAITKPFIISIKDTLDIPTDVLLSNASITENAKSMTAIGILSTVDANVPVPTYTYTFVAGKGSTNNSSFSIKNDTLYTKDTLDFEVKNKFSIRVRTTLVNGMYTEKEFAISVLDLPSTGIVLSNTKVYENEPAKQFVAKISTISQDKDDRYTYSFGNLGTNDNASFLIENDTLWANRLFDFETKSSYNIYITSTSLSGAAISKPFVIGIKDSLDVPTDLALSRTVIEENLPARTLLAVLNTVDANTPTVLYTYTFVAGTGNVDSSLFEISHDSVYTRQTFDAETKTNYQIRIRSTLVNKMFVEKAFAITVLNVNEPPTFTSLDHDSIPENTPDSTFVGYLNSIDQDVNEWFRYSFVSGTRDADNKAFAIKGNGLFLVKAANFEKKNFYRIQIRTTDKAGLILDSMYTIYIVDVNEAPKIVLNSYEIEELSDPGTSIGTVEVKDEDKNQTYVFDILNPDMPFYIHASTGELTLKGPIDYETKTSYDLLIRVKDSGSPTLADSLTLTIHILDEIENDQLPSADLVSPNGDGSNDTWKIRNVYLYSDYTLQIIDQNSQLVYSVARNYNNDWDAKLNGQTLPNGIYYYTFKSNTDGKLFKGYITVLK